MKPILFGPECEHETCHAEHKALLRLMHLIEHDRPLRKALDKVARHHMEANDNAENAEGRLSPDARAMAMAECAKRYVTALDDLAKEQVIERVLSQVPPELRERVRVIEGADALRAILGGGNEQPEEASGPQPYLSPGMDGERGYL